jgi:hypothetical protein
LLASFDVKREQEFIIDTAIVVRRKQPRAMARTRDECRAVLAVQATIIVKCTKRRDLRIHAAWHLDEQRPLNQALAISRDSQVGGSEDGNRHLNGSFHETASLCPLMAEG